MDIGTLLLGPLGLVLLTVGAEAMVRGAASLAVSRGVSPLVVGLTIVAFGTSAPELTVSMAAALRGTTDIAYGNVVGSNICNVLLVLGLCAAIAPLMVARQLVRVDVPIMIGASLLTWAMVADGVIGRVEGLVLAGGLVAYVIVQIRLAKRGDVDVDVEEARGPKTLWMQLLFIAGGVALLVAGSNAFVTAAVAAARALGVSDLVAGLTIVALGTSAPEIATSVVATIRGERDIAVGNVVGSNIFNIFSVLGVTAAVSPGGVPAPRQALVFDTPYMVAVAVACLPLFFSGYKLGRWKGWLFLTFYAAYTAYLVLDATDHHAKEDYSRVAFGFVAPLVGLTLVLLLIRAVAHARAPAR